MRHILFLSILALVGCSSSSTDDGGGTARDAGTSDANAQGSSTDAGTIASGAASATLTLRDPSADYNGRTGDVTAEPLEVLSALTKPPSIQIQVKLGTASNTAGAETADILCQLYQSKELAVGDACDMVVQYERAGTGRWAIGANGKGKGTIDYFDGKTVRVTFSVLLDSLPPNAKGTVTATGQMTVPAKSP